MPSNAARARCSRSVVAGVIPSRDAVASGRFGVRSPTKYGTRTRPSAPAGAASASRPSSPWSTPSRPPITSSTRAALSVVTIGRRAPVASAKPATVPLGSASSVSVTPKTVPLVPRDTATSPGPSPRPRAAPALSPVPAPTLRPDAGDGAARQGHVGVERAHDGVGRDDAGHDDGVRGPVTGDAHRPTERELEQLGVVGLAGRVPVRRAAGVGAVGREGVEVRAVRALVRGAEAAQPPRQPVVGECDRCHAGRVLRLRVAEPAQLRAGERGHRDQSRAGDPRLPAEFLDHLRGRVGAADVVPEEGVADDAALGVERDHAVLLAGDRDGGDVVEPAGVRDRGAKGVPPVAGVDRRAVRVGRATLTDDGAGGGVADRDFAALGRRVDPCHQRHRPRAPIRCSTASCCSRTKPKPLPPKYASASKSSYAERSARSSS